jgi:hypothetical protein
MREQLEQPTTTTININEALAAPFSETEVKFKPQVVKNNRAMALAYVDVRAIMDRLDDVLGVGNWQDHYEILADNSVMCRLRLFINGRWITKSDVGSPSEQPDSGDRLKAAVSDALKRAAVKFGIGRYLYRLPQVWADYDPVKKQFVTPPKLPLWAQAKPSAIAQPKPNQPTEKPTEPRGPKPSVNELKQALPATGAELHRRLREADSQLAAKGACSLGSLLAHVTQAGIKAGYSADLNQWVGPAIEFAVAEVRHFKATLSTVEAKNAA